MLPRKRQQWIIFLLLLIFNVANNNVKVSSAAMEKSTMGYIRIVAYVQCNYQQCKCSVLHWNSNNGFYSYCCLIQCSYQQCKSVQCCHGNANNGFPVHCGRATKYFVQLSTTHVKLPDISDDFWQISSFWIHLR